MGQIVAMKFPGEADASQTMLRLRHCTTQALGILTAVSISIGKTQKASVEQLVDPLNLDDYRWSSFWIGLLYACQADFLTENFPLELMHQVPLLFLDRAWWTKEINISSGFLNDIQVLLYSKESSVLMAFGEGDDIPLMRAGARAPDTTLYQDLSTERMQAIQKIIHRQPTSTVSYPSRGNEE